MSASTKVSQPNNKKIDGVEVCLEDDPYLIELHKRLVQARNDRKTAEAQSSMLENRLNLLKGEEEKSIKEVERIKTKYKSKYDTIKQVEKDLKQKIEFKQMKEEELEKQKAFNSTMRSELVSKMKEKREEHVKELFKEMMRLKEVKKANDDVLKHIKMEETNTNKNKYEFFKTQKSLCHEKKRAKMIEKKNSTREQLENKIIEENNLKNKLEDQNKKLGEEEIDIMKKIKTTTKVHQIWVAELEKIDKQKAELSKQYKTKLKGYKERKPSAGSQKRKSTGKKDTIELQRNSSVENTTKYKVTGGSPKRQIKSKLNELKEIDVKEGNNNSNSGYKEEGKVESKAMRILEKIRLADKKGEIEKVDPILELMEKVPVKRLSGK